MFETLRDIGGVVGLLGGLVVFYDRFFKNRPVASLTVREENDQRRVCIRVKNTTNYDIVVVGVRVRPLFYSLVQDEYTPVLKPGSFGEVHHFILKPDESRAWMIMPRSLRNVSLEPPENRHVNFWVSWRRGNATWMPQVPVPVFTSTEAIQHLRGIALFMGSLPSR
jgi:hypothetical protein